MKKPKVSVMVLNYNGKEHIEECLHSLKGQSYTDYEIVLVDNGSTDGSLEYVKENFPPVHVVPLDRNYGFAEGNNRGVVHARGDLLAFLNNDTRVEKQWLSELVNAVESDPKIGICGSKMLMYYRPKFINSAGQVFSYVSGYFWNRGEYELDSGQYEETEEVVSVCAGAMMVRKDVFLELGGFDPAFYANYEDIDICLKVWISGRKVLYVPSSVVYHKVGASFRKIDNSEECGRLRSRTAVSLSERNRWRMYLTKYSGVTLVTQIPIYLSYYLIVSISLLFLQALSPGRCVHTYSRALVHAEALAYNIKNFGDIMKDRQKYQRMRKTSDKVFLRFGNFQLIPARMSKEWRE